MTNLGTVFGNLKRLGDSSGVPIDPALKTGAIHGLEIAAGNVPGRSVFSAIGLTAGISTPFKDIWDASVFLTLNYDAKTGSFTPGLVLTGNSSGATARIVTNVDNGSTGILTIRAISGVFQDDEIIVDSSSGSATSDGLPTEVKALVYPTAGETWEVVCESADDNSSGIGAGSILITYLDSDYNQQTTIVALNGHTPVALSPTNALRFIRAAVLTFGSNVDSIYGKTNLGTIVIRDSVSKNIRGAITYDDSLVGDEHGLNFSQSGHFTVLANKTAYLINIVSNTRKNNDVNFRSLARFFGEEGFLTLGAISNYQGSFVLSLRDTPLLIPEKTDVKIIAKSDNNNAFVAVQTTFIFIDNE